VMLPHFICPACRAWNGTEKGRTMCRVCETPAPDVEGMTRTQLLLSLEMMVRDHNTMAETLTRVQAECTELREKVRRCEESMRACPACVGH
jgi:hypothetical protein